MGAAERQVAVGQTQAPHRHALFAIWPRGVKPDPLIAAKREKAHLLAQAQVRDRDLIAREDDAFQSYAAALGDLLRGRQIGPEGVEVGALFSRQ